MASNADPLANRLPGFGSCWPRPLTAALWGSLTCTRLQYVLYIWGELRTLFCVEFVMYGKGIDLAPTQSGSQCNAGLLLCCVRVDFDEIPLRNTYCLR